ncbi:MULTISPECIES: glycosyltransferase [unclassified Chryseobacterium]|uniref:glycosyltransferase n=1 Tax=unclassified Chryseobacterium TaxID=2593645 RepID=UPI00226A4446|nr:MULTISPECIES: glycosyltransferase [unclassified Chryseobacterium]
MGLWRELKYVVRKVNRIKKLDESFSKISLIPTLERETLKFPKSESPVVSIIIPFYNQENYTWNCLKSIFENLPEIDFEIILMDDNSSESYDFSTIENITIIKNPTNLGFLKSCNKGIEHSSGKFIYLLNNDTIVHKGFLDELIYVFNNFENVGAVGSMLMNADGSLQEAGSVFMKDCNIAQIVDKRKPYYPIINYIYKVDYCSGCSLLFKKHSDNGDLNLFDEQFAPAYFEETDLCFRFKYEQKKDIYYTPFSKIVHFNGASYNAKKDNTPTEKEKLFEKNLALFKSKWNNQINSIQAKTVQQRVLELNQNKNIFFYNNRVPEYDKNSGELRLTEIIKAYKKEGYNVVFIAKRNKIDNSYNEYFQRLGVCVYYEYLPYTDLKEFYRLFDAKKTIAWFYAANIFIKNYKKIQQYFSKVFTVYDMVDIHHLRFKRALDSDPKNPFYKKSYSIFYKFEKEASSEADLIIPISEEEKQYMDTFAMGKKQLVISNIHYPKINIQDSKDFAERKDLLFIGSTHHPNIDAIYFLANKILPLIWKKLPDVKLNIIGDVNEKIKDINSPNIIFHGYVPDIVPHFLENRIMVAPLRYGAGVKGKIGQAFEFYLPVITSAIGAEGMLSEKGDNMVLADNETDFAEKTIELYTNENLWKQQQLKSADGLQPFSLENLHKKIREIEKITNL